LTEPFEPAPTGKPSGIPAETRLAEEPRNPFEALRTRTLIPWMILGGALLFAALLLASLVTPLNTFRSQSHGTFPLLFNAIHYGAAKRPGPAS